MSFIETFFHQCPSKVSPFLSVNAGIHLHLVEDIGGTFITVAVLCKLTCSPRHERNSIIESRLQPHIKYII